MTLASSSPLRTTVPSWKLIATILPEVSNERSTSSSGSRLPTVVMPSVSRCGRTMRPLTLRVLCLRGAIGALAASSDAGALSFNRL